MTAIARTSVRAIVVVFVVALSPTPAHAQTYTWNAGTSNWFTPGNWTGGVPTTTTSGSTIINNGGTPTISTSPAVAGLVFFGDSGTGNLMITTGGTLTSGHGFIGNQSGSTGFVTVNGGGSTWNLPSNDLNVGYSGNGTLNIQNGGQVSSNYGYIGRNYSSPTNIGTGIVTVDGASAGGTASKLAVANELNVGVSGNGTLKVQNGGQVTSNSGAIGISYTDPTVSGSVTVDGSSGGTASKWAVSNDLDVGYYGNGTLKVQNGGQVTSNNGYIGTFISSPTNIGVGIVTVDGSSAGGTASKWAVSNDLYVGYHANGALNVQNGGLVTSGEGGIGYYSGSTGSVTVDGSSVGTASKWAVVYGLDVGDSGSGTLKVQNGGQVTSGYGTIGYNSGSTGSVTVDGVSATGVASKWAVTNDLNVGYFSNGTLKVQNGGQVTSAYGSIGAGAGSTGLVNVTGSSSAWTNGSGIYIGGGSAAARGTGTLSVSSGGAISNTGLLKVWNSTNTTLTLDGGSITTQSFERVSGGTVNHYDGTLTVNGNGSNNFIWGNSNLFISGNNTTKNPLLVLNNVGTASVVNLTRVGDAAYTQGQLTISGGTVLSNPGSGTVGYSANSTGMVTVTGRDSTGNPSTWTAGVTGNNVVGESGTGTLFVQNGGHVDGYRGYIGINTGSNGTATVDGSGSMWTTADFFRIGSSGTGTLNVTNGGAVSVGTRLEVNSGGTLTLDGGSITTQTFEQDSANTVNHYDGTLTVNGNGSNNFIWGSSYLRISGNNTTKNPLLVLNNVGTVNLTDISVGAVANTKGQLTISGGTVLTNSNGGLIGNNSGSTGVVTVTGVSSTWTMPNDLVVGVSGNGTLNVQNGGQVQSIYGYIGTNSGSTGVVTVTGSGSTWKTTNTLFAGLNGSGTLNVQNGGQVQAGLVSVGSLGTLAGDGTVIGPVIVQPGGTLRGGLNGVGTLTLNSPLTLASGSIVSVAINNSASPTSSNFLSITGGATINSGTKFFLDGTGATFTPATTYHFKIASGAGDQHNLLIATQSQFSGTGFTTTDYNFSVTGNTTGDVFVNFVPVPEPAAVIGIAVAALGFGGFVRRRLRQSAEVATAA